MIWWILQRGGAGARSGGRDQSKPRRHCCKDILSVEILCHRVSPLIQIRSAILSVNVSGLKTVLRETRRCLRPNVTCSLDHRWHFCPRMPGGRGHAIAIDEEVGRGACSRDLVLRPVVLSQVRRPRPDGASALRPVSGWGVARAVAGFRARRWRRPGPHRTVEKGRETASRRGRETASRRRRSRERLRNRTRRLSDRTLAKFPHDELSQN